jgi:hypothetical protein
MLREHMVLMILLLYSVFDNAVLKIAVQICVLNYVFPYNQMSLPSLWQFSIEEYLMTLK